MNATTLRIRLATVLLATLATTTLAGCGGSSSAGAAKDTTHGSPVTKRGSDPSTATAIPSSAKLFCTQVSAYAQGQKLNIDDGFDPITEMPQLLAKLVHSAPAKYRPTLEKLAIYTTQRQKLRYEPHNLNRYNDKMVTPAFKASVKTMYYFVLDTCHVKLIFA